MSYFRFSWEGFQLFTIEYYTGCGFVINSFYYLKVIIGSFSFLAIPHGMRHFPDQGSEPLCPCIGSVKS